MENVAVIIKHPFRDLDYRVDIYQVPSDYTNEQIRSYVMSKMLGHFQIVAITRQVNIELVIK